MCQHVTGKPIELGHPGFVLRPLVIGPDEVPVIAHPDAPELAVVSAAVHGAGPEGPKVFTALLDQLATIEQEKAKGYIDELLAVFPAAAQHLLEAMMSTRTRAYKSDFARHYVAEGRAEGARKMILVVLAARGIAVPDAARARITECTDLEQLEAWGPGAATITTIEELFD